MMVCLLLEDSVSPLASSLIFKTAKSCIVVWESGFERGGHVKSIEEELDRVDGNCTWNREGMLKLQ